MRGSVGVFPSSFWCCVAVVCVGSVCFVLCCVVLCCVVLCFGSAHDSVLHCFCLLSLCFRFAFDFALLLRFFLILYSNNHSNFSRSCSIAVSQARC